MTTAKKHTSGAKSEFNRSDKLIEYVEQIDITSFLHYRLYLLTLYERMAKICSGYNYDLYTADLGLPLNKSAGNIVLNNGSIDLPLAGALADQLKFTSFQKRYFFKLVEFNNINHSANSIRIFTQLMNIKRTAPKDTLNPTQKSFFSKWYIPVISELALIPGFNSDPQWIADRLIHEVSLPEIEEAVGLLNDIGILKREGNQYVHSNQDQSTGAEVSSQEINNYHRQLIEVGKSSLELIPQNQREISNLTVKFSHEKAQKIKTMIQEFEEMILNAEDIPQEAEQVFELNVQFFPVTRKKGDEVA